MAERIVQVEATLKIKTKVDLVLYDDETVENILPQCLAEGLKQYLKDYDSDMKFVVPEVLEIHSVEERYNDREGPVEKGN